MEFWASAYNALALVLGLLLSAFVVWLEKEAWKRFAVLTFCMLLLPQLSADYTLIHVFLPLMLFLNARSASRLDLVYATLFGVLLIPLDYVVLIQDVKSSVVLYPLAMVLMIGLIVGERLLALRGWTGVAKAATSRAKG